MKDLKMLIWLTQLGLSVIVPLGSCVFVAVWLNNRFGTGVWIVFAGLFLGGFASILSFRATLTAMNRMADSLHRDDMQHS